MSKGVTTRASAFVSFTLAIGKDMTTLDPQEEADILKFRVCSLTQSNDNKYRDSTCQPALCAPDCGVLRIASRIGPTECKAKELLGAANHFTALRIWNLNLCRCLTQPVTQYGVSPAGRRN